MGTDKIIADVLMNGADPDVASRRITCNMVASRAMFCNMCGNVLDEKTVVAITVNTSKRRAMFGYCDKCWKETKDTVLSVADQTKTPMRVENWNGVLFEQGEVD